MLGRVRSTLSAVAPDYSVSSGYGSNSYSDYGDVYSPTSSHGCKSQPLLCCLQIALRACDTQDWYSILKATCIILASCGRKHKLRL